MKEFINKKTIFVFAALFLLPIMAFASGDSGESVNMTHKMMMLAMQLGVILFAARIGNIIAERIKLPGVLGELGAGIIIGPFMLGAISFPGFHDGLFPVFSSNFPISPELYGFATIASIILLFVVGLETDIKLFLKYSVVGSVVGISGVLFSFLAGNLLGVILLPHILEGTFGFFSPSCIFLGVMSTATSVGISARILSEKRKLDSPEGVTILAGAVIDDVLGIIMLALGLGIIAASKEHGTINWGHIGIIAAKAIGIWLAATLIGIIAARKISILLKWFRDKSHIALMALGLALILAALFEEANLAMIIGAYVMGLSLSKTDISHVIQENLHHIYAFLVPVFFAVMGMLVDVSLFFSWKIVLFGLLYSFLAVLAKVFGCGIPAMFCNFNFRGAMRIGIGMLPRGEVALIIAGIGLASGILNQEIFAIGIMMTLITTVAAPPALVAIFKNDKSGLRKHEEELPPTEIIFSLPSPEIAGLLSGKLQEAFENDGFYVHTLSHEDNIFQLRKDDIVMGFQNHQNDIIFDCNENETQFVNTAMIEVIADFEQTIKELKKPVDINSITKNIPAKNNSKTKNSLAQFLVENAMITRIKGETKEEIIDELLEQLNNTGVINDLDAARETVLKREESMSTGMQFGVAIPHGRTDGVKKLVATIGLKPEGVDFQSMDGEPSTIFVLALSPKSSSAPHMQFMAMISNALDESGREKLLQCANSKEMFQVLTK